MPGVPARCRHPDQKVGVVTAELTDSQREEVSTLVEVFAQATRQLQAVQVDVDFYAGQRMKVAWLLREYGLTYRDIGIRLGISGTRAHQLVLRYEDLLDEEEPMPDRH